MLTRDALLHMRLMLALLIGAGCSAQQPPAATALKSPSEAAAVADPAAALNRMGGYLRTLRTFTVEAESTTDEVLADTGQKIQFGGRVMIHVRAPDRLRVDLSSDRKERQLFYDGKTLTLYGQRTKYYASAPAPPTIREALTVAEQKYGIEFPLADLFYWGTDKAHPEDIKSSTYVGPSWIGGALCDHYAFRQDGADWQIWIERSDTPLPRKLVITTTDDDAQPQHVSVLTWKVAPSLADAMFTFVPPPDAQRIVFREIRPAGN